jgi:ABC-2 type transport system permease protein
MDFNLSAPRRETFLVSIVIAILVVLGMIVPLPFFPDGWQPVLNVLPFRGLGDVPYRMFSGHLPLAELPLLLAHQLAWTAALVLLGRWLLSRAQRRLVVQGG